MSDSSEEIGSTKNKTARKSNSDIHPTVKRARKEEDAVKEPQRRKHHHPHDAIVAASLEPIVPALPLALIQDYALSRRYWCGEFTLMGITKDVCVGNNVLDFKFSPDSTEIVLAIWNGTLALTISEQSVDESILKWENDFKVNNFAHDPYGFAQHPEGTWYAFLMGGKCDFRSSTTGCLFEKDVGMDLMLDGFQAPHYTSAGFTTDGRLVLSNTGFTTDGRLVLSNGDPTNFHLLVLEDGGDRRFNVVQQSLRLCCNHGTLPISCDNNIVAQDEHGVCGVWNLDSGERKCTIPWSIDDQSELAWSNDGTMIGLAIDCRTIEVYRLESLINKSPSPSSAPEPIVITVPKAGVELGEAALYSFTPDNRSILTYCKGLKQWDAHSGQLQHEFPDTNVGRLWRIRCSPNGKYVAGHEEQTIIIWNFGLLTRLRG